MASLIKKLKKGIPYYYVVESKRINGKPRIVEQHYLGTADKIFSSVVKWRPKKNHPNYDF